MIDIKHGNLILYICDGEIISHHSTNDDVLISRIWPGDLITVDNKEYIMNGAYFGNIALYYGQMLPGMLPFKDVGLVFLSHKENKEHNNIMNNRKDMDILYIHNNEIIQRKTVENFSVTVGESIVIDDNKYVVSNVTADDNIIVFLSSCLDNVEKGSNDESMDNTSHSCTYVFDIINGCCIDTCPFIVDANTKFNGDCKFKSSSNEEYHVISFCIFNGNLHLFVTPIHDDDSIQPKTIMINSLEDLPEIDLGMDYVLFVKDSTYSNGFRNEIGAFAGVTKNNEPIWVNSERGIIMDEVFAYSVFDYLSEDVLNKCGLSNNNDSQLSNS